MAPQTHADLAAAAAADAGTDCGCEDIPEQVQMGAPPPLSTEVSEHALPHDALRVDKTASAGAAVDTPSTRTSGEGSVCEFSAEDTIFIFDWDDTVLPSTWVQGQGLRLDSSSRVTDAQREELAEVARVAGETLAAAKQHGEVVLVTNAQRGWIELSCAKFLPTLLPLLESVKLLSARTTYESAEVSSPLEWKLRAFEAEIFRITQDCCRAWNVLSLGDSLHEREALLRATAQLPNCRSKSLKFVERPDVGQICKQHALVTSCFQQILHHDGNLDLCIRCE